MDHAVIEAGRDASHRPSGDPTIIHHDPLSADAWVATDDNEASPDALEGSSLPPTFADMGGCRFDFLDSRETRRIDGAGLSDSEHPTTVEVDSIGPHDPIAPAAPHRSTSADTRQAELVAAATVYLQSEGGTELVPIADPDGPPSAAGLLERLHEVSPRAAERLARGMVQLPGPGDELMGFRIIEELGRGTFGRVFLAQQGELASRLVALKVTAELPGESQTLAQLQHTNIVPIFSVHHAPPLHAVCMPYFGRATLADMLDQVVEQGSLPSSGLVFAKMIGSRRSSLQPGSSLPTRPEAPGTAPISTKTLLDAGADRGTDAKEAPGTCSESLRDVGNLSYVNAVLWMIARIAAGLDHAHKRGILHRDLKPANVLLTDDGQPMILDFNLSEDIKGELGASTAAVGGTLRYMSPEHLSRFLGKTVGVDARSDLFALGVILHELLTGQSPFPTQSGSSVLMLHRMIDDRHREVPSARLLNPMITPAIDSIIRCCLAPEPGRRYASADHLREDLERHLADLPLRYAPEVSLGERTRKWLRRHPRLGSNTTAAVLLGIGVCGLVGLLMIRGHNLARFEAAGQFKEFRDDVASVRFFVNRRNDPIQRQQGQEVARRALERYGVLSDPGWIRKPVVANLAPAAITQLRSEVAEMLLMLTEAILIEVDLGPDQGAKAELARSARRLNQLALMATPEGAKPRALQVQRAALARILDGEREGQRLAAEAEKQPLVTARDHYLAAVGLVLRNDYKRALPLADEAVRLDPSYFWAYFIAGVCHDHLGSAAEAMACFTTCTALRPDFADSWIYRGISYLKRDNFDRARGDFDRAVRLRPDWFEPYLMRALAYRDSGDHLKADGDLSQALRLDAPKAWGYFLRSAERRALGDRGGAEADLTEAMKHRPHDASAWVSRGMARLETTPLGALADFEEALKVDPNSLEALQMSAYILSDLPGRDEDTIRMLDRAVAAFPEFVPVRSGRGVQLAILGRREEAHRDARESLWRDNRPAIQYQVAGIYAMTSKTHPEDRPEAYRLLGSALRAGFGFDMIDGDHELDPIRDQPEFRALVDSARAQATERVRRGPGR